MVLADYLSHPVSISLTIDHMSSVSEDNRVTRVVVEEFLLTSNLQFCFGSPLFICLWLIFRVFCFGSMHANWVKHKKHETSTTSR